MQTNQHQTVPYGIGLAAQLLMAANPDHSYEYFTEEKCTRFLAREYPAEVLEAYQTLIPGAYKADLFRYCYLFKRGGVYIDTGQLPAVEGSLEGNAKTALEVATDERSGEHTAAPRRAARGRSLNVLIGSNDDFVSAEDNGYGGVYNAFMACTPGHPIMGEAIQRVLKKVKLRKRGRDPLSITGPVLLGRVYKHLTGLKPKPDSRAALLSSPSDPSIVLCKHGNQKFCLRTAEISRGGVTGLITKYPGYYDDQKWYHTKPHYSVLWAENKIYAS